MTEADAQRQAAAGGEVTDDRIGAAHPLAPPFDEPLLVDVEQRLLNLAGLVGVQLAGSCRPLLLEQLRTRLLGDRLAGQQAGHEDREGDEAQHQDVGILSQAEDRSLVDPRAVNDVH